MPGRLEELYRSHGPLFFAQGRHSKQAGNPISLDWNEMRQWNTIPITFILAATCTVEHEHHNNYENPPLSFQSPTDFQ
jgi:hypothetical protein